MKTHIKLTLPACMYLALFASCKITYESGYQANKQDIAVNLRQHNLQYILPPDSVQVISTAMVDKFDYSFLNNTWYQVRKAGFSSNDKGSMGTTVLKDCFIEFNVLPGRKTNPQGDTFNVQYLRANLLCKDGADSNKVFYSYAQVPEKYRVLLLDRRGVLNEGMNKNEWTVMKYTAVKNLGFDEDHMKQLSVDLSINAVVAIDTLARATFHKEHPDVANDIVRTGHLNTRAVAALAFVTLILVMIAM